MCTFTFTSVMLGERFFFPSSNIYYSNKRHEIAERSVEIIPVTFFAREQKTLTALISKLKTLHVTPYYDVKVLLCTVMKRKP